MESYLLHIISVSLFALLFNHVARVLRSVDLTYQPLYEDNGKRYWCVWGWWCQVGGAHFNKMFVVSVTHVLVVWISFIVLYASR